MTIVRFSDYHKATEASELKAAARLLDLAAGSKPEARAAIMEMVRRGLSNMLSGQPGKIAITEVDEGQRIAIRGVDVMDDLAGENGGIL